MKKGMVPRTKKQTNAGQGEFTGLPTPGCTDRENIGAPRKAKPSCKGTLLDSYSAENGVQELGKIYHLPVCGIQLIHFK